jgi:nucleoside-diphosphate-sugar epimerase
MAGAARGDVRTRRVLSAVVGTGTLKILLTGGTGFIGRWAGAKLLRDGHEVHIVTASGKMPEMLRDAHLHKADLLDPAAIAPLLAAVRPTHLLHFAWNAVPGVYWTSPDNDRWLGASLSLLQAFRDTGGQRAVMAGSCAEYDWAQAGICNEATTKLNRHSAALPYINCKIALQELLQRFGADAGISTAWGRIFFQYGPYEHPNRLVSSVIRSLLQGEPALCTHGRQVRSFLHAADVGSAFSALLISDVQGPVNIGSAAPISLAELVEIIGEQIGRPELIRLGARAAPAGEPDILLPGTTRLEQEVGWRPQYNLQTGLADTIAWWRDNLP